MIYCFIVHVIAIVLLSSLYSLINKVNFFEHLGLQGMDRCSDQISSAFVLVQNRFNS